MEIVCITQDEELKGPATWTIHFQREGATTVKMNSQVAWGWKGPSKVSLVLITSFKNKQTKDPEKPNKTIK